MIIKVTALSTLQSHRFGISASITIAALFWLTTATVEHCSHIGDGIGSLRCKSDVLITFLFEQQRWPYQHMPFIGYWESFDNKLVSIVDEPYSQLALAGSITYLIWFRIVIYARKRSHVNPTIKAD